MLKNIFKKLGFGKPHSSPSSIVFTQPGIPVELAGAQLMVSTRLVKELIEIQRSRGVKNDPRARMIGNNLYQFGGIGSLTVAKQSFSREKRGQCGLAMSRSLVGGNPTWVIVSREPSIEPCGAHGNGRVDA